MATDASGAKPRWYMPDYGSGGGRALVDLHEDNEESDSGAERGDSVLDDILKGIQKTEYSLVKEESTCFDPAALVDTSITESDVSGEICQVLDAGIVQTLLIRGALTKAKDM